MRGIYLLIFFIVLIVQHPADAFLIKKKDYKQNFINDAISAEKRNNDKQAFYSYEKALFYYKKDAKVLEEYAKFCERKKFFKKSEELYGKLYILTKSPQYLFKKNLSAIKNGTLTSEELKKLTEIQNITNKQKVELNKALIFHFSYKNDWKNTYNTCKKIPISSIDKEVITTCIVASERNADHKNMLNLYLQYSALYPNDSAIVNKILSIAEKTNNIEIQEKFIKKLSGLNPKDFGIKYKLAGFYEKQKQWKKAASVYQELIKAGDKSEHVKKSLVYVESELNRKNEPIRQESDVYKPQPLSKFKLAEKNFYEELNKKNYSQSQVYLDKMLKEQPRNLKLLKHKVDIAYELKKYREAINYFDKINKIKSLSLEDSMFLAFLYSKDGNNQKALLIVEENLKKSPNDGQLLGAALGFAMSEQNWDKAIEYNNKLLVIEPSSEKLLKNAGDLYSIKKDFPNAIKYYEKLVQNYPKEQYKFELANLYMANQEFAKAEIELESLYQEYPNEKAIISSYLNSLLAQRKLKESYWVIKNHNLQNTKEGYSVFGDMAMLDKDYEKASKYYKKGLDLDPEDLALKNKLANSYRMIGYKNGPLVLYKEVLDKDPKNFDARLGLGSLEIDNKNFDKARAIFNSILKENPNYRPAKVAIAHSYIANDEKIIATDLLDSLPEDDETKLLKAQSYYDMKMWSDSKDVLKGFATKDAQDLKYKIRRDDAITITPNYMFFFQQLADEFNLDYFKYGLNVSKNINNNTNVFMDYNVITYMSGSKNYLTNVVNEFRGGAQSRVNKNWEYRADLGVKAFQFGGGMLNTNSWIKYYVNDKFNVKLGYKRDNIEQSYLSAVGYIINGVFTGRCADNKFYTELEGKLPHQIYAYARGSYGVVYSANLVTNQYFEAMLGAGKILYNNPNNKWINTFAFDVVSYNMGFQYDQLKIYTGSGQLYGGYYSPGYFNATTGNIKAEGNIKPWHLKYGIKAFGGIQTAISPDQVTQTWGFSPYIAYDINDNITINAMYNHFTYADLVRDQFFVNAVFRGFKKNGKK